jgi:Fe-S cluster assembly ATP-binding protein
MTTPILEVSDLAVSVGRKKVLKGVSLTIGPGEVHVLMGPNGGGKTTLLLSIMGMPGYTVTGGRIVFRGEEITGIPADARARKGIALAFQKPPSVRGVTVRAMTGKLLDRSGKGEALDDLAGRTVMKSLLDRELNVGLSGGEVKRSEMLQLLAMEPELALFDEPESGVDLDNITVVGNAMRGIVGIEQGQRRKSGLIVTHTGHILQYVPADMGHVLMHGTIVCRGNPTILFEDIKKHGYGGCATCRSCQGI